MDWLKELKEGDSVGLQYGTYGFSVEKVAKVLPTQIVLEDGVRYSIADGKQWKKADKWDTRKQLIDLNSSQGLKYLRNQLAETLGNRIKCEKKITYATLQAIQALIDDELTASSNSDS